MKITYDKEIDAMYIYFKKEKISKTVPMGDDFIIDIDKNKNIVGLEILNASRHIKDKESDKKEISRVFIGNKSFALAGSAAG